MTPQVQTALATLRRITGRQYPALEKLLKELPQGEAAMDLLRLTRDIETEMQAKVRRAVQQPWRGW